MRDINTECKYQSDLFKYACMMKDCSSLNFVKQFAYSDLARRMDHESYLYCGDDVPKAYDSLKKEKKLTVGKEIIPIDIMAWVGYIMRYFSITKKITTKRVYQIIKPKELCGLYEAYHSLDNDLVIKRILESKNVDLSLNNLEVFKKLYKK